MPKGATKKKAKKASHMGELTLSLIISVCQSGSSQRNNSNIRRFIYSKSYPIRLNILEYTSLNCRTSGSSGKRGETNTSFCISRPVTAWGVSIFSRIKNDAQHKINAFTFPGKAESDFKRFGSKGAPPPIMQYMLFADSHQYRLHLDNFVKNILRG